MKHIVGTQKTLGEALLARKHVGFNQLELALMMLGGEQSFLELVNALYIFQRFCCPYDLHLGVEFQQEVCYVATKVASHTRDENFPPCKRVVCGH
jgi:hypothetical protein